MQTHPEFCSIPVYLVDLVVQCVVKHSWHVSRHIVYLVIFVCELKLKELKALQKQVLRARLCQPGCANNTWQSMTLACSPLAGRMVGQRMFGQIYNWSKWCIMMSQSCCLSCTGALWLNNVLSRRIKCLFLALVVPRHWFSKISFWTLQRVCECFAHSASAHEMIREKNPRILSCRNV